jgi:hypothetical protein
MCPPNGGERVVFCLASAGVAARRGWIVHPAVAFDIVTELHTVLHHVFYYLYAIYNLDCT